MAYWALFVCHIRIIWELVGKCCIHSLHKFIACLCNLSHHIKIRSCRRFICTSRNHHFPSRNHESMAILTFSPRTKIVVPRGKKMAFNQVEVALGRVSPRKMSICAVSNVLTPPRDQESWSHLERHPYLLETGVCLGLEKACGQQSCPSYRPGGKRRSSCQLLSTDYSHIRVTNVRNRRFSPAVQAAWLPGTGS